MLPSGDRNWQLIYPNKMDPDVALQSRKKWIDLDIKNCMKLTKDIQKV
jgi:hypothetical protein